MEIDLLPKCVLVNERQVAAGTTVTEFLGAVDQRRSDCRLFSNPNGNILGVVDRYGINFLYAEADELLHLFMVKFERADSRRMTERDPKNIFGGVLRVGGRPVPLPPTISMAELIRQKQFDAYNLTFTPNRRTIASMMVSFDAKGRPGGVRPSIGR